MNPAEVSTADEQYEYLLDRVCSSYGVTRADVEGPSHEQRCSWPRQVLCYALVHDAGWYQKDVGARIGRDHSSIYHAVLKVTRRIAADGAEAYRVTRVCEALQDAGDAGVLRELQEAARIMETAISAVTRGVAILEELESKAREFRSRIELPVQTRRAS